MISAQTDGAALDASVVRIKAAVKDRGTGEKKRVEVKSEDGKKLKGYISQAAENSFRLVDSKTKHDDRIR